jgi:signal transduction histidine kinase
MRGPHHSLASQLTIKLILLQVLTLLVFAMCMPVLQIAKGYVSFDAPDPKVSDDIASAMRDTAGGLTLVPSDLFTALTLEAPDLWFVAVNSTGAQLTYGSVPTEMDDIAAIVTRFDAANFADLDEGSSGALLALEQTAGGEVRIVFGNGPSIGPLRSLARSTIDNIGPLVVIVVVLATATSLLIPRLISSSLAGMRRAVRRAKTIDIDRRGTRLPTTDVPLEIVALVDAINDALERIDDGYERQQRFLADAAHELRTPIAILHNRIELIAAGQISLAGNRLLLDVQRIANLAEQLLDLQRIDSGDKPNGEVDLVALARHVIADLAPMAIEAGYEAQVTSDLRSTQVIGDRCAIERALINLVQNAIAHAGNHGTIEVHVTAGSIAVSDDGLGIAATHRQSIFEPFHRISPKDRGAGLGLSLVREIMTRHNGSVLVGESRSGGACFTLQFAGFVHRQALGEPASLPQYEAA